MSIKEKLIAVEPRIAPFADIFLQHMQEALINTPTRQANFLGQCHVESGGFSATRESMNYAADSTMMKKFINWGRITAAQAQQFGRTPQHPADQKRLANILYGGTWGRKNLGNIEPDDGWDFRGGGFKQLTGRDNYSRFSKEYFGDDRLVRDPSLINSPVVAVASAVWFWSRNKLNVVADRNSVEDVTRIVNGGQTDLAKRKFWTNQFLSALSKE